jgi:ubiquinone/menaquinone biosynthesis C-methylase UbiE
MVSRGDIFDLRIDDNSYNIVICCMVLPFIPRWRKALSKLVRVTKKHLFLRLLLSDYTYIIKIYKEGHKKGASYEYYNIYSERVFVGHLMRLGMRNVQVGLSNKSRLK